MRNQDQWTPTKYLLRGGRLRATRDRREVAVGSRLIADRVARAYDEALKVHARGRLLDMGCGKAPLYGAYSPHVSEVQCVDWSHSPHGLSYVDRECDLTQRLPYADGSFDTIILSDVLEHLAEPMNCWREMNRLLAPGGKVILNVPFYYPLHETPHDYYRYTEHALQRFAELSGFDVLELRPIGGPIEVIADVSGKVLARARMKPIAAALQSLAGFLADRRPFSRLSGKASRAFPLGYFMVAAKRGRPR
jgi:SAM-dependent methyltransferase